MGMPPGRTNHYPTTEEQSLGGKSLSPLKIVANSTRRRKYCNPECLFAESCPMLPLSLSNDNVVVINGRPRHPCKLKDAPTAIKRRIKNMFLNGEEGLLSEIKSTLFVTSTKLGDDNKERLQYASALMNLHKNIYGEQGTSIRSPEPLEITVRQLSTPTHQAQEVAVHNNEGIKLMAQKLLDKRLPTAEEEPNDPESLFTSPILDDIVGAPDET
jgi:hypothetical protein